MLTALAVSGEGSTLKPALRSGSLWSGCFPTRDMQLHTFAAMEQSTEAFKAGSGEEFEWNGTAIGSDGTVNPNFIFGWPPDWIGSIDPAGWDWQTDYFGKTVEDVFTAKFSQMYDTFNARVADISGAQFTVTTNASGKVVTRHDPAVLAATDAMSAFLYPEYLTDEAIILHHSDRDFYSLPGWNSELAAAIVKAGGRCFDFNYPGNNHSLKESSYEWFNTGMKEVIPGRNYALQRDIALFSGDDPEGIAYP